MAFRGSFDYTLDAKNRLTIPVKFRGAFADGVVLARLRGVACVSIWRTAEFDSYVASLLDGFHPLSDEYESIQRFYNSQSHDTELDSAGRVMIPAKLLEVASLQRDVVVNGVGNRLEVWAREAWGPVSSELSDAVDRIRPAHGNAG